MGGRRKDDYYCPPSYRWPSKPLSGCSSCALIIGWTFIIIAILFGCSLAAAFFN